MRARNPVAIALFLVGMVGACAHTVSDHSGSETNWLATCDADSDCSTGKCLCGVCTAPCTASSACSANADTCAISGTTAHGVLCGDTASTPAGVCVPGCGDGAACGTGFQCVAGGCVPSVRRLASGITRTVSGTTFTDVIRTVNDPSVPTENLTGRCLQTAPDVDVTGHTACSVIEVRPVSAGGLCSPPGRAQPSPKVVIPAMTLLKDAGICGVTGAPDCSTFALCAVQEMTDSALQSCQHDTQLSADAQGWCFVDAAAGAASAAVVDKCPADQQRMLRLNVPNLGGDGSGGHVLVHCVTTTTNDAPAASTPGEIGDSCAPSRETQPDFSGFSELEVNVETGSPQCSSGICLASHFRGRTSCAYGQPAVAGGAQVDPSQQRCMTTGPNPVPVTVPVQPQLTNRPSDRAVYCSCRCDGPDPTAQYCACPSGFTCTKQVTDYGFGDSELAGSYCIKDGTQVTNPTQIASQGTPCSVANQDCGPL